MNVKVKEGKKIKQQHQVIDVETEIADSNTETTVERSDSTAEAKLDTFDGQGREGCRSASTGLSSIDRGNSESSYSDGDIPIRDEICKKESNNAVEQSAKGRRYTATEITTVKTLLENGYSVHEIAIKLGRTISGIRAIKHKVLSRTSQKKAEELKALSLSNALAVVASSSSPSSSVALASQPPSLSTHDDVLLMKTVAEMMVVIQEDVKGENDGRNTGECEGGEDDG